MAGGALRELLSLFQLEVDSEELEKGAKHLEGFIGKVKKVGEVVAEAFAVHLVKEFFEAQIEAAAHVQDLADRLDVSASSLKSFSLVAASAGIELDAAAMSLGFLSSNLGKARLEGGATAQAFSKLGVNLKNTDGSSRDLMDVVGDVAEGLSRLPDQQVRAAYAMQLFGREGKALLPILAQDKDKLKEMLEEANELSGGLGDEYYANSKKAREATERFGFAMETIKARIANVALPAIIYLYERLKKLALGFIDLTKHTYILQTGLIFLSALAGYKLVATLGKLGKAIGLLKPTIGETVIALLEFAAPIIIIGGLYLIFDDLFTLMKGGDSLIGEVLDSLFGFGAAADTALYLNAAWDDTVRIFKDMAAILAGAIIPLFTEAWHTAEGLAKALYHLATLNFSGAVDDLKAMNQELQDDAAAGAKTIADAGKDLVGGKALQIENIHTLLAAGVDPQELLRGQNAPAQAPTRQAKSFTRQRIEPNYARGPIQFTREIQAKAPQGAGAVNGSPISRVPTVNQTNTYNTTVHAATDKPKALGDAIGQGVASAHEKSTNNALIAVRKQ